MKTLLLTALLAFAISPLPSFAETFSADQKSTYRNCARFFLYSPKKQSGLARQVGISREQLISSCEYVLRFGIGGPERAPREPRMGTKPRKSPSNSPGLCFKNVGCNGAAVASHQRILCPIDTQSFQPENSYLCESW